MAVLTKDQFEVGLEIRNINNPEWGIWRITSKYDDGTWTIKNHRNSTVLFEGEARFWEVVA